MTFNPVNTLCESLDYSALGGFICICVCPVDVIRLA